MQDDIVNKLIEINMKLSEENGALKKEIEYLNKEIDDLDPKKKTQRLMEKRKQMGM